MKLAKGSRVVTTFGEQIEEDVIPAGSAGEIKEVEFDKMEGQMEYHVRLDNGRYLSYLDFQLESEEIYNSPLAKALK